MLILLPRAIKKPLSTVSCNYLNQFYPSYFADANLGFDTFYTAVLHM